MDDASLQQVSMRMSPVIPKFLHWAGSILALTGIIFFAIRLHEYQKSLDLTQITPAAFIAIAGLAMIYGAANLLLVLAWRQLLVQFGVHATRLWSIRVYGLSQLAKYVPGNIFHLAGRQAIGMATGASSGVMAKSILWELGLIALAGMVYGWLVLPLLAPEFPSLASILLLLATVWIVAHQLRRFIGVRVAVSFIWQMLFLAVSGVVFLILLDTYTRDSEFKPQTWLLVDGAYVIAWFVGLVTPGAPAGVGVRELVLLLLLRGIATDADLLVAILLGRVVTLVGDALFFMMSLLIPARLCLLEKSHEYSSKVDR